MPKDYFAYVDNFKKYKDIESKMVLGNAGRGNCKFTIAIPTFKRPKLLEKSLQSAVNQKNIDDYEIIIIDNDPSGVLTQEIVKKHLKDNVYYFKNEKNIGMFGNWNRCIELAKGEYITILNDDDWLSDDYLIECVNYLDDDIDGLYFRNNIIDLRGNKNKSKAKYEIIKKVLNFFSKEKKRLSLFDFFLGNQSAGTLGVLMKTDYLKKLGGYNPKYFPSSDYVLHANYCYNFNVYFINKKLNYYRILANESAKQETLRKWEVIDYNIRKYLIRNINMNKQILDFLNELIQENRIQGMVDQWGYRTNLKSQYRFIKRVYNKIIAVKYYLNL
ncbi:MULTISPECIES: glycosyltransferase family 2 protein [unclassified Candidatus Frackibacter]|uniref:glycosyltransferase family 2 protein n=1 Tax=unclassified Candidatus Frackibacter TaxID=2648818 RepID=UPI00088C5C4E|nr:MULTISPECIES: glycosyltransferase family 2 protein [unclassified Candidatus Frackibacter]SDC07728.1 Glycosyl transferase family 2 [Candidatus Frackibacter sp. WG11]SEM38700.1 Glycosyl transferase family 2 [Candidatus Frackibacter sp. WG12]SFL44380.1 Glycosyl transferase family 2 [Candidatus Frackibacter sp. WG13]